MPYRVNRGTDRTGCTIETVDRVGSNRTVAEVGPDLLDALGLQDPCAPGDATNGASPAAPNPALVAMMLWDDIVGLPDPILHIAPGESITGLPAYAELSGPTTEQRTYGPDEAAGYTMTIDIRSTYDIDWGDGTLDRGITSQGGPWPDGDVRHTYQHANDANVVTVTQWWWATWNASGNGITRSGTLTQPLYTSTTLELPVGEIQAVVTG